MVASHDLPLGFDLPLGDLLDRPLGVRGVLFHPSFRLDLAVAGHPSDDLGDLPNLVSHDLSSSLQLRPDTRLSATRSVGVLNASVAGGRTWPLV